MVPGDLFSVGRGEPPHAVRLCLTTPRTREELEKGLTILSDLLGTARTPRPAVI